ncbi:MAG: TetR/AcrR family transcriptional regulator [Myxococcales bacterium]|jgi:TetR/AcrR family fatty acid metabolism transcriptional regulator|nr:TetR/AcrR family transcriptional regulator [Myxococcales bacterium]
MAETAKKPSRRTRARAPVSRDKRERILAAAVKVFAKHGFYATRVSDIAKEAGVADGTIYLYFKNKDDVLISIFDDRIRRLIEVLHREIERCETTEERLRRIIEIQLGLLEGERELAEVVTVNLRQSTRMLKQYATPLFMEYLGVIASVIAEGQREGTVRADISPRLAARAMWGSLDGIAVTWALADGDPANLRTAAKQFATLYWAGLAASTPSAT